MANVFNESLQNNHVVIAFIYLRANIHLRLTDTLLGSDLCCYLCVAISRKAGEVTDDVATAWTRSV